MDAVVTATSTSFDRVYRVERASMRRLAYLVVGSYEAADDVVHDAFVELHRRWAEVDNPGGYLRTTVVRRAITAHRRRLAEHELVRGSTPPAWVVSSSEPPVADDLWHALDRLSPRQRAALVLRYYEDRPAEEIAAILGCEAATVRSLVHRGLAQLRREVSR